MVLITELLSSNIVQIMLTFASGAILYFFKVRIIIVVATIAISLCIILSFVLDIGEVYVYSDIYRRAFFIFEDDIGTVISLGFLYAFATKRTALSLLALSAVFMSGGKASIILLLIMMVCYILIQRLPSERKQEFVLFFNLSFFAVSIYAVLIVFSSQLLEQSSMVKLRTQLIQLLDVTGSYSNHRAACLTLADCYENNVQSSIRQRYYSSVAGLWMTLEGGYSGKRYPGSSEKFADLMMMSNPWGINDKYGLTWSDWKSMGHVQNPYMSFGSGYGLWLLLILIGTFACIGYFALRNLLAGASDVGAMFSIYFIVIVTVNQTQSWLMSGSMILMLLGLCTAHNIICWLLSNNLIPNRWELFVSRNWVL
jgi:hypothetical protein